MLLTTEVEVKWNGQNKVWLLERGYIYTQIGDLILVKVEDLKDGCHSLVDVLCDYCKLTVVSKEWRNYIRDNIKAVVNTDCCAKCQQTKTKECNLINFGVESKTELKETKDKMKSTMMENHGVEYNMQNKEIRDRTKATFLTKYGSTNPMDNKLISAKSNKTKIQRYGSTNTMANPIVRQKAIDTNLKKYGTEWQMQNKEVMEKSKNTMYENGSAPCSRPQKYLHNLYGGKLNYPVDRLSLDIAFPEDMVYIEYDGNGHDLSVKLGNISEDEFKIKEMKRYMYLKSKGWKQIRIVSPYDYLPSEEVLIQAFIDAIDWFKVNGKNRNHYIIDIGIKINNDKYGEVRKLKLEVS